MTVRPALREDRYVVRFEHDRQPHPVIAWSEDGAPLILGKDGSLVPASTVGEVASVTDREFERIIPATSGVYIRFRDEDSEEGSFRLPVAYWLVDYEGWAKPVALSNDTYLEPRDDRDALGIEWDDPPGPRQ